MTTAFLSRAGRAGPSDIYQRLPELFPLRTKTIAVFGLGCLGAPSAFEFARCGIARLRLLDPDFVDPGTIVRWPVGLRAAGLPKAEVIANIIGLDYPYTEVSFRRHALGAVREPTSSVQSEHEIMRFMTDGASLIFDATAEVGVQQFLADYAARLQIPYVSVNATPGGWGGHVLRIDPRFTEGCWLCYQERFNDADFPELPALEDDEIQPAGCGDPTFTGSGFDMLQVAMAGVRMAVATLCGGDDGAYPYPDWDATVIALRNADGQLITPTFTSLKLLRHQQCRDCNPQ